MLKLGSLKDWKICTFGRLEIWNVCMSKPRDPKRPQPRDPKTARANGAPMTREESPHVLDPGQRLGQATPHVGVYYPDTHVGGHVLWPPSVLRFTLACGAKP